MPSSTTFGVTEYLPGLLLAAGVSLLSFLMLMNLRFKLQRRAASRHISPAFAAGEAERTAGDFEPAAHVHAAETAGRRSTAAEDTRLAEAHESARQLITALDSRCRTLEVLLQQADDRIRQLEEALDDRVGASISPTRTALPSHARRAIVDDGEVEYVHAQGQVAVMDSEGDTPLSAADSATEPLFNGPVDPLTASVYELSDRGRSALEIARYLDEQVGKVELILALRGDRR